MSDRIPSDKWGVVQVLLSAVAAKGKVFGKTKLAAVLPVDIPTGWEPRTKQQPTGLIAYPAAQGRAVQVLLSAQKKKRHTNVCSPVDIPTGWEPRTKQQPTGLLLTLLRRAVLFKSSYPHKKEKTYERMSFLGAGKQSKSEPFPFDATSVASSNVMVCVPSL